jgi:hypothetical protein
MLIRLLYPALSCLLVAAPLAAQVNTGAIIGKVTDPSSAVVTSATTRLENLRTGARLEGKSNEVGDYSFRGLLPGVYKLTVTAAGFRTFEKTNIPVAVSETTTHNVSLTLGEPTSSVTVEADLAAIDTSSATLGTVVEEREVRDLPLNGRHFTQLLTLTTGVATPATSASWGNPQVGDFRLPSINGQSTKSTQFLLDGTNNSSPGFALISVAPVVDDIAEFKVVSHADSAEYGGVLGGYVNVVTKSGTNELHGGMWEFFRNDKLDARNFFRRNVTPLRQNQFGGNIGGPVMLPHYDGRNRTFFFGSYQGFRQSFANSALYRVPTPQELSGDLSREAPIFDPFSTRADPANPSGFLRDAFPSNRIPGNRIDSISLAYARQFFPAPIDTGFPGTNGLDPRPNLSNQDLITLRGDHQAGANAISLRYNKVRTPVTTTGGIAGSSFLRKGHGFTRLVRPVLGDAEAYQQVGQHRL